MGPVFFEESVQFGNDVLLYFLELVAKLSLEADDPRGGKAEAWELALFGWCSGMHGSRKSTAFSGICSTPKPAVLKAFHAARAFWFTINSVPATM